MNRCAILSNSVNKENHFKIASEIRLGCHPRLLVCSQKLVRIVATIVILAPRIVHPHRCGRYVQIHSPLWKYWDGRADSFALAKNWRELGFRSKDERKAIERNSRFHLLFLRRATALICFHQNKLCELIKYWHRNKHCPAIYIHV